MCFILNLSKCCTSLKVKRKEGTSKKNAYIVSKINFFSGLKYPFHKNKTKQLSRK